MSKYSIIKPMLLVLIFASSHPPAYAEQPDFIIPYPYRKLQISNSHDHGFTVDTRGYAIQDSLIYLGTVFDGSIYQYNLRSRKISPRFKINNDNRNGNSAGSMLFDDNNRVLYAGTSISEKRAEIYLFDTSSKDSLPFQVVEVDPKATERIKVLFSPIYYRERGKEYIFWGCYHYEENGPAKIIKFDLATNSVEVIKLTGACRAIYTYSLSIVDQFLFVSTERGQILRYDLFRNSCTRGIDLSKYSPDARHIQHLASDGYDLWAMTNAPDQPLFLIENPTSDQFRVSRIPDARGVKIKLSRLYVGPSGNLYGQGFKISRFQDHWKVDPQAYISYGSIGAMIGGFRQRSGDHFIIGENFRIKDDPVKRDRISLNLGNLNREELFQRNELIDPKSEGNGAILHSIGTDQEHTIYLSTYWIGFLYKINSDAFGVEESLKYLIGNDNNRINAQVDVIKHYQGGDMLFGHYMGTHGSARLMFYDQSKDHWVEKKLPETNGVLYPRIMTFAIDDSGAVYLGSGERTFNASTPDAVIFKASKRELYDPVPFQRSQRVNFVKNWPDSVRFPKRIMAMEYYDNSLYCVGLSMSNKGTFSNQFFRINLSDKSIDMLKMSASSTFFSSRILLRERTKLLLGLGSRLYYYDLDRFDIEHPDGSVDFSSHGSIRGIIGDENSYYIHFDNKILTVNKRFELDSIIDMPTVSQKDRFQAIELLNDHLYAITRNGICYRWKVKD